MTINELDNLSIEQINDMYTELLYKKHSLENESSYLTTKLLNANFEDDTLELSAEVNDAAMKLEYIEFELGMIIEYASNHNIALENRMNKLG